jgi:hypothetical protein
MSDPPPAKKSAADIRKAAAKKAAATRKANARRPGAPPLRPVPAAAAGDDGAPTAELPTRPAGAEKSSSPSEPSAGRKVWEEIRGAAEEVSERSGRPPTITELNKAFGRLLSTGTLAAASYFAESDERLRTDGEIDQVVADLTLAEVEAAQITYPLARLFGRSRLNRRAGRELVDNVEIGESAAVLVTVALRWRRYLRGRSAAAVAAQPIEIRATEVARPPAAQPNPFDGAAPEQPTNGSGVLATPDMVERLRRTGAQ